MTITLERIKNIALDIIADDEWVIVGGHSGIETALYNAEHKGIVYGLHRDFFTQDAKLIGEE